MNNILKSTLLLSLLTVPGLSGYAADNTEKDFSYVPNIHGVLRPRFEYSTQDGRSRFQVRNARLSVDGRVAKSIDYFLQVDLCDQGSIKPLDFWVRMRIVKGLSIQAGQFRMPFGVDCFRAPHTYLFANRSFIGKQMCNFRAVGGKVTYSFDKIPLQLEAGIFNSTTITSHTVWNKEYAYSAKAAYTLDNVKLSTGFMSIYPESVRTNLIDGCISWSNDRWLVEGEYMYEHYTGDSHKPCHGYNMFVDYKMPIRLALFNRLSFQGRFDGMTDHSSAKKDESGDIITNDPRRNRITVGSTISYIRSKNMFVDIRANYEKYFYAKDVNIAQGQGDKFVLEMVLRF